MFSRLAMETPTSVTLVPLVSPAKVTMTSLPDCVRMALAALSAGPKKAIVSKPVPPVPKAVKLLTVTISPALTSSVCPEPPTTKSLVNVVIFSLPHRSLPHTDHRIGKGNDLISTCGARNRDPRLIAFFPSEILRPFLTNKSKKEKQHDEIKQCCWRGSRDSRLPAQRSKDR